MSSTQDMWDASKIPDMRGKCVVITGGNSGIGYHTALELCRRGATIVIGCRNEAKGKQAAASINGLLREEPNAGEVKMMLLDVSSLSSVKKFAVDFKRDYTQLDLLINNAGVMAIPYNESADGYELQFATNHIGHFALTASLFDLLKQSPAARIVNVSSIAHRDASMREDIKQSDLLTPSSQGYSAIQVYRNTKLTNLLFTFELDRRLRAAGLHSRIQSVACHPGISKTNLMHAPQTQSGWLGWILWNVASILPFHQSAAMGALPSLYASSAEDTQSGEYFGPSGWMGFWGYPVREKPMNRSMSESLARKVWEESERLCGMRFHVSS